MAELKDIVEHLDSMLHLEDVADYPGAWNGLQVECRSPIDKVCVATDACLETIEQSAAEGANLLIVHHGLFWTDPLPITGRTYRRLRALIEGDVALYSAHLPLDVHPLFGNNPLFGRALGLAIEGRFGKSEGMEEVGVWAVADQPLRNFVAKVEEVTEGEAMVIQGGPPHVRRVAIVTGAGGSMIEQAHAGGFDTLLTGEGAHHTYHDAIELGVNVIYAGHYATETLGVKAVGKNLAERFGVEWSFIDNPTGM